MSIPDGWDWRFWTRPLRRYCVRVGDAVSQLLNVVIFFSDNPNESISGRSWRSRDHFFWGGMRVLVDWLASPLEADHCRIAHEADIARAKKLVAETTHQ